MEENTTLCAPSFMSASIDQLTTALSAFQGEVEQPALNSSNPYFKSKYVDLSGILKAVQPLLAKNGLAVAQILSGGDLITLLTHKSGQWLKSICPLGNYKSQQDRGSAITYTKRYALSAILGIAGDTDDDGNAATDADKKKGSAVKTAGLFTGGQLQQALGELNACKTRDDFSNCWTKWANESPAMCQNGTEFYKAAAAVSKKLNESAK